MPRAASKRLTFIEAARSAHGHRAARAVPWRQGLSSWQGSGPIPGDVIEQVIEATGVRTRPLKQAREWGYQRLSRGRAC
jgi:hypothetical protein